MPETIEVRLTEVWQEFPGQEAPILALQQIDALFEPGSFVSIVGSSGCGKSTLLRIIAGLQHPTSGSVLLSGNSPAELKSRKGIAWMAQQPALLPWLSVRENIELPQRINTNGGRDKVFETGQLLKLVRLEDFAEAYPHTLSGGMQQRVALARALATGAQLWLMDEPFSALDELTREELTDELLELWTDIRPTVIWVTHNLAEAVRISDRVLVLSPRPGRIVGDIPVNLPRKRDESKSEFQTMVRQVRALLGRDRV